MIEEAVDADAAIANVRSMLGDEDGFVYRYVRWAVQQTDSTPVYHVAVALALLSAVAPRNARTTFGHGSQAMNLYAMVVGDSGASRKSWSIEMGASLLRDAMPEVIGIAFGSYEAMVASLSEVKVQLVVQSEFSRFMSQSGVRGGGYLAALKTGITDAFDGGPLSTRTQKGGITPTEGYRLSMLAAISRSYLSLYSEPADFEGGFLSRWLFASSGRWPWKGAPSGWLFRPDRSASLSGRDRLVMDLQRIAREAPFGVYGFSDAADQELYCFAKALHQQLVGAGDEYIKPVLARCQALAQRISGLFAMERSWRQGLRTDDIFADWTKIPQYIELEDVQAAIEVVGMHHQSTVDIIAQIAHTPAERLKRRILATLDGTNAVAIGTITRRSGVLRREAENVLETLQLEGLVESYEVPSGRVVQRMYARRVADPVEATEYAGLPLIEGPPVPPGIPKEIMESAVPVVVAPASRQGYPSWEE